MQYPLRTQFRFCVLVAGVLFLFNGIGRSQQQDGSQICHAAVPCACPALKDPARGVPARIFAGGPPGQDTLVIEDAMTGDAYRYVDPGWQRIGSSARTYALRTKIYRLAGDARPEMAIDDLDNWQRISEKVVGSDIFASINNLYMVKPPTAILPTVLYRWDWDGGVPTVVDIVAAGPTAYVGNDSGVYKRTGGGTFKYDKASNNWSQIGSDAAVDMFPAAGTLFIRSSGGVMRYLGTPFQWANLGTGLGKISGTTTAAYAIVDGNIVRLDPGNMRTTVRNIGDTQDIAAGGTHIFVLTTAGTVLRLEESGTWTDISCRGSTSSATCASCVSGPIPSGIAPSYNDIAQQIQNQPANQKHNVLTRSNDNARTGAALHEDILTPSSLVTGRFGYLGSVALTGRIYAQPLYVKNAAVVCEGQPVTNANTAYVATLENIVYAIDIDQQRVCWQTEVLGVPQKALAPGCLNRTVDGACNGNFNMNSHAFNISGPTVRAETGVRVGIASTPVIDLEKSVMYVVTRVRDGSDARGRYFVQVLDTRTGKLVAKVEAIADTLNGREDCNGQAFHPSLSTQRAGLLLVNDKLFVAFSANAGEDSAIDYHGHVLGFDVSNPASPTNLTRSFCATPNPNAFPTGQEPARGGGIWMAGGAPASDGTSAYFSTGNGAYEFDSGDYVLSKIPEQPAFGNWPNSFVKLGMDMSATGYNDHRLVTEMYSSPLPTLVPNLGGHTIFWGRERSDADLGAAGVLLLGNRLIGGGKDGRLYVIDTATMSHVQDFQAFVHMYDTGWPQKTYQFLLKWYDGPHIHGSPIAWDVRPAKPNIYVFAWGEKDLLRRFSFNPSLGKFEATDAIDSIPGSLRTVHGDIGGPAPGFHSDGSPAGGPMPGGMLSLSANGSVGGIVWATIQEPYKFCNKVDPADGQGPRILVDQPFTRGDRIPGCDIMGGYVPGRLYAFAADVDSTSPTGSNRLKLLWGDSAVSGTATFGFPGTSTLPNNFIPAYAKHSPPTIAHGKVLVATANGELRIYGLGSAYAPQQRRTSDLTTDDIALTGLPGWPGIDVATSNGDCSFNATTHADSNFAIWASTPNVARLTGDFNNDGYTDVALVGGADWTQAKIAFSNGNGTFSIRQGAAPNFMSWATSTTAARLVGDFNGDRRSDIALIGDPNWHTIPVAFSNGDASFAVTNEEGGEFAFWATSTRATKLIGDFNGDGKSDIALVGEPSWHTIPVAHSRGDGSFQVSNGEVGVFGSEWAPFAAERVVGDFNGDGRDDIALIGNSAWHTIPVAFSDGTGAFFITNSEVGSFAAWAALPGVKRLVGDFNGDGRADIALVNVPTNVTAGTIPIAFSNGDGTFRVTAMQFPDGGFRSWAGTANVQALVGDFNHDGYADIALTGGSGWFTIPCALSKGDGTFLVHNDDTNLRSFGQRSAQAGADATLRPPGHFR